MLQKFIDYLNEMLVLGCIYVLGALGQTGDQITESWIKMREHYIASDYNRAIAFWRKQLTAGFAKLCAFDCNGLGNKFILDNKLWPKRLNANGMKGKCVRLTRQQLKKGDWVFRVTLGHAHHIGYVVDDSLNVIECFGRDKGVIKRHVDAQAGYWNYYGRPLVFKAEIEASPVPVPAPAPIPAPAPLPDTYAVKKGDTLGGIARKFKTTIVFPWPHTSTST